MRSRYCAYVLDLQAYLQSSWHASTRPSTDHDEPAEPVRWLGLQIKRHRQLAPDRAEVEFVARYRQGSRGAVRLHETSTFVQEHGHWFYLDGEIHQR